MNEEEKEKKLSKLYIYWYFCGNFRDEIMKEIKELENTEVEK